MIQSDCAITSGAVQPVWNFFLFGILTLLKTRKSNLSEKYLESKNEAFNITDETRTKV